MYSIDEYIKNNVSLENYSDEMKNLMSKIENQSDKLYKLEQNKTLTLDDINEYKKVIREMKKIVIDNNIESYDNFLEVHIRNLYEYKEEMALTTSDINTLNELMKDRNPYIRGSIAENPNATHEMLRELSKEYSNTMAIIENPNTPIDLLEKYCLDKYDIEVYERAIEKLQERQQNTNFINDSFDDVDNYNDKDFNNAIIYMQEESSRNTIEKIASELNSKEFDNYTKDNYKGSFLEIESKLDIERDDDKNLLKVMIDNNEFSKNKDDVLGFDR